VPILVHLLQTLGVLGVSRRGVDQPDGTALVIDRIPHATTAGHFVLPLLEIFAIVSVRRQLSAKPVLPIMACPATGIGMEDL
jgi:hypothetical protein